MIEGAGCINDEDRLRLCSGPAAAAAPAAKTHGPKAKRAGKVAARPSVSVADDSQTMIHRRVVTRMLLLLLTLLLGRAYNFKASATRQTAAVYKGAELVYNAFLGVTAL
jgi:hypothetical protein